MASLPPQLPQTPTKAVRILFTVILLGSVAMAALLMWPWSRFNSIFDSMVEGGIHSLPFPQPLMLGHPGWKIGWLLLPSLAVLFQIWRQRSRLTSTLILTLLTGFLLIAASSGGTFLLTRSLSIVVEKFQE